MSGTTSSQQPPPKLIISPTFNGVKPNYIFTTRNKTTGYYLDQSSSSSTNTDDDNDNEGSNKRQKTSSTDPQSQSHLPPPAPINEFPVKSFDLTQIPHIKSLILTLETSINHNLNMRSKHSKEPLLYIDSEIELYSSLEALSVFYNGILTDSVKSGYNPINEVLLVTINLGVLSSLLGCISHVNLDVSHMALSVVGVFGEFVEGYTVLIDEDFQSQLNEDGDDDDDSDSEDGFTEAQVRNSPVYKLIEEFGSLDGMLICVLNLQRVLTISLDENENKDLDVDRDRDSKKKSDDGVKYDTIEQIESISKSVALFSSIHEFGSLVDLMFPSPASSSSSSSILTKIKATYNQTLLLPLLLHFSLTPLPSTFKGFRSIINKEKVNSVLFLGDVFTSLNATCTADADIDIDGDGKDYAGKDYSKIPSIIEIEGSVKSKSKNIPITSSIDIYTFDGIDCILNCLNLLSRSTCNGSNDDNLDSDLFSKDYIDGVFVISECVLTSSMSSMINVSNFVELQGVELMCKILTPSVSSITTVVGISVSLSSPASSTATLVTSKSLTFLSKILTHFTAAAAKHHSSNNNNNNCNDCIDDFLTLLFENGIIKITFALFSGERSLYPSSKSKSTTTTTSNDDKKDKKYNKELKKLNSIVNDAVISIITNLFNLTKEGNREDLAFFRLLQMFKPNVKGKKGMRSRLDALISVFGKERKKSQIEDVRFIKGELNDDSDDDDDNENALTPEKSEALRRSSLANRMVKCKTYYNTAVVLNYLIHSSPKPDHESVSGESFDFETVIKEQLEGGGGRVGWVYEAVNEINSKSS